MRGILFRGKRLDNGEWVYGYYCKHIKRQICPMGDELKPEDIDHLIINDGFADWNMPIPLQAHKVDPAAVGQYTGLKDKNGVRIFEGDFTHHHRHEDTAYLVWHERHICFVGKSLDENGGERYYYQKRNEPYLEVIGNIHDNPELLEVRNE